MTHNNLYNTYHMPSSQYVSQWLSYQCLPLTAEGDEDQKIISQILEVVSRVANSSNYMARLQIVCGLNFNMAWPLIPRMLTPYCQSQQRECCVETGLLGGS